MTQNYSLLNFRNALALRWFIYVSDCNSTQRIFVGNVKCASFKSSVNIPRITIADYYHLRILPIGLYTNYINENIPIAHFY